MDNTKGLGVASRNSMADAHDNLFIVGYPISAPLFTDYVLFTFAAEVLDIQICIRVDFPRNYQFTTLYNLKYWLV